MKKKEQEKSIEIHSAFVQEEKKKENRRKFTALLL